MKAGRIVETNAVQEILESPQDDYTRTLLGSMLDDGDPVRVYAGEDTDEGAHS